MEDEEEEDEKEKEKKEKEEKEELNKERSKKKTGRSYHAIEVYHSDDPARRVQLLVSDFDEYTVAFRRWITTGVWGPWQRLKDEVVPSWLNSVEIEISGSHTKTTKIGGSNCIINMFYALARYDRGLGVIREALLLAVIMFCEAHRLYWILQTIIKAIADNLGATDLVKYWGRINCWGQLSKMSLQLGKFGAVHDAAALERIKSKCGYSTTDDIVGPKGDLTLIMRNDLLLLDLATKELLQQEGAGENIEDPKF